VDELRLLFSYMAMSNRSMLSGDAAAKALTVATGHNIGVQQDVTGAPRVRGGAKWTGSREQGADAALRQR
jgi:hypothetical protein